MPSLYRASAHPAPVDADRLVATWRQARAELLAERNAQGHWVGELSSSPLSTATAISALAVAERHAAPLGDEPDSEAAERWHTAYRANLSELILTSVRWLAERQNPDGGWGDTDRSGSNLATTLLVLSAFRMTGVPAKFADLEPRAEQYIRAQGGTEGLKKRYGGDKTFAAPILANCALAGVVHWREVPTLPFELAAAPQSWFRLLRLPVVSYAIPALVAIGLAKHHHQPTVNPVTRWLRNLVTEKCLSMVTRMQPDSGGFLEATPLTSFVVMALASAGRADHPVVRRGVEFLLASVRPDGSWPIDTNLATWNTTLAVIALAKGDEPGTGATTEESLAIEGVESKQTKLQTLNWLLACQHTERHPFTDADPGGWAWTNLSGGVPDADDTSGALIALKGYWRQAPSAQRARIERSVVQGLRWLVGLQNADGGWPTFCRGWGKLPFDRSATDLTAHALRALHAWRDQGSWGEACGEPATAELLACSMEKAISAGLRYLRNEQSDQGSWAPLWFGNERRPNESNPVFGTARVLLALAELEGHDSPMASQALQWLVKQQHPDGGWGTDPDDADSVAAEPGCDTLPHCSVEETAVAVDALLRWSEHEDDARRAAEAGLAWLCDAVEQGRLDEPAPIGLYFAKLWYHERLYPKSFAVSALGSAVQQRVASRQHWGDDKQSSSVAISAAAPA